MINQEYEIKMPVYESRYSEKVITNANKGFGRSDKWWRETIKAYENGLIWCIYLTPAGNLQRWII